MDAFVAQLLKFVRAMPDDAILELVRLKLGSITAAVTGAAGHARGIGGRRENAGVLPRGGTGPGAEPQAAPFPARQELLNKIERLVKASTGMSASEVAEAAGVPQTRVAAALKELKLARRIFQGGDRRFARYAGDARTAEQASQNARKTATGPILSGGPTGPRSRRQTMAPGASTG